MEIIKLNTDKYDFYYNTISTLLEISATVSLHDTVEIKDYTHRKLNEMKEYLQREDTIALLACLENKAVGFIWCHAIMRSGEKRLHVAQFAVLPQFRGRGIGTVLLREAEKYAKQDEYIALELFAAKSNDVAFNMYESYGFAVEKFLMCKKIGE